MPPLELLKHRPSWNHSTFSRKDASKSNFFTWSTRSTGYSHFRQLLTKNLFDNAEPHLQSHIFPLVKSRTKTQIMNKPPRSAHKKSFLGHVLGWSAVRLVLGTCCSQYPSFKGAKGGTVCRTFCPAFIVVCCPPPKLIFDVSRSAWFIFEVFSPFGTQKRPCRGLRNGLKRAK